MCIASRLHLVRRLSCVIASCRINDVSVPLSEVLVRIHYFNDLNMYLAGLRDLHSLRDFSIRACVLYLCDYLSDVASPCRRMHAVNSAHVQNRHGMDTPYWKRTVSDKGTCRVVTLTFTITNHFRNS